MGALRLAREERVWLMNRPAPSVVPGVAIVECTVGEPALELEPAEVARLFTRVLRPAAQGESLGGRATS